jgi:hypothetical protein
MIQLILTLTQTPKPILTKSNLMLDNVGVDSEVQKSGRQKPTWLADYETY